jgi:hypothetical protein
VRLERAGKMSGDIKSLAMTVLQRLGGAKAQSHAPLFQSRENDSVRLPQSQPVSPQSQRIETGETPSLARGLPDWWQGGARCWHCQGHGMCRCIVCDAGPGAEALPGPCTVCGSTGCVPAKVQ